MRELTGKEKACIRRLLSPKCPYPDGPYTMEMIEEARQMEAESCAALGCEENVFGWETWLDRAKRRVLGLEPRTGPIVGSTRRDEPDNDEPTASTYGM